MLLGQTPDSLHVMLCPQPDGQHQHAVFCTLQGIVEVNHILDDVPEDAGNAADPEITTEQLIAEKQQVSS